jgi:hypothetical protein
MTACLTSAVYSWKATCSVPKPYTRRKRWVFRIGSDGTLGFVRKYDVDPRDTIMFWMGMVPLSSGT